MAAVIPEYDIRITSFFEAHEDWLKICEANHRLNPKTKDSLNKMFIHGLTQPDIILDTFIQLEERIAQLNTLIIADSDSNIDRVDALRVSLGENTTLQLPPVSNLLNNKQRLKKYNHRFLSSVGILHDKESIVNHISSRDLLSHLLLMSYSTAISYEFREMHRGLNHEDFLELLIHSLRDIY